MMIYAYIYTVYIGGIGLEFVDPRILMMIYSMYRIMIRIVITIVK